jgi:hypothetical protein
MFAPTFENMALREKNGKNQVLFLTVCESDSSDAIQARGIRAFPTFHLYLNGNKVDELTGASEMNLLASIEKHRGSAAPMAFAGHGHTLSSPGGSGASSSSSPPSGLTVGGSSKQSSEEMRAARLRTLGLGAGAGGGTMTADQKRAALIADPASVDLIVSMGFTQRQAITALTSGGNPGNDIEMAISFIEAQQLGTDFVPSSSSSSSSSSATSSKPASSSSNDTSMSETTINADSSSSSSSADFSSVPMTEAEAKEANDAADAADAAAGGSSGVKQKLTMAQLEERVRAMRAAKAVKAKEEARLNELKRREDGKKKNETTDQVQALQRKAEADRIQRARDFDLKEKNRLKLEMLKDKAEREAKMHGHASDETMAAIKLMVEGKPPPPSLVGPELIAAIVNGLCHQKVGNAGRQAADLMRKMMDNVVNNLGEPKYRLIKLTNKLVAERIIPVTGAQKLLTTVGFEKEETPDGPVLKLTDDNVDLELLNLAIKTIDQSILSGKL